MFLPVINNYSYDNFVLKACDKNILLMKYLVFSILQKRLIKSKRGTKGRNGTGTLTVVLKISRISMPGFIRNSVVGVAIAQTWSRKNEAKNLKGVGGGEKRKKKKGNTRDNIRILTVVNFVFCHPCLLFHPLDSPNWMFLARSIKTVHVEKGYRRSWFEPFRAHLLELQHRNSQRFTPCSQNVTWV